mgnify:CR=1 FL=1
MICCLPPIGLCVLLVCLASFASWVCLGLGTLIGVLTFLYVHGWRSAFRHDVAKGGYGHVTSMAPAGPDRLYIDMRRPAGTCGPSDVVDETHEELSLHGGETSPVERGAVAAPCSTGLRAGGPEPPELRLADLQQENTIEGSIPIAPRASPPLSR